jgi:hypothetical protein
MRFQSPPTSRDNWLWRTITNAVRTPFVSLLRPLVADRPWGRADYEEAAEFLEGVRRRDPHNLAHIDTLSNILYVNENRPRLAELARAAQVRIYFSLVLVVGAFVVSVCGSVIGVDWDCVGDGQIPT